MPHVRTLNIFYNKPKKKKEKKVKHRILSAQSCGNKLNQFNSVEVF